MHYVRKKIISTCNCGRSQNSREEPFTIREANHGFYARINEECCEKLERYNFSVFFRSDDDTEGLTLQEMLQIVQTKSAHDASGTKNFELDLDIPSQGMEADLQVNSNLRGNSEESDEEEMKIYEDMNDIEVGETLDQSDEFDKKDLQLDSSMAAIMEKIALSTQKIVTQDISSQNILDISDSKLEYLPGMLHSKSLKGLLPLFSSWSLVCLGSSR